MIKKFIFIIYVLFSSLFLISSNASAITLSYNPYASSVIVGQSIDIDIVISDMESDYLGAFDFNINYDDSILTFDDYTLGSQLGDISSGDADDWSFGDMGGGIINLAELSWLWDLSFQPDSFTLATLSFTGNSIGSSSLSFSDVILRDDGGSPLSANLESGSVDVTASIPDPATCLLLFSGLIVMVGTKKKFS